MTALSYDAVVVGAGPNGLVAANRLADAGWSVVVLEAQPSVGGAVRSDRDVHPAFVHDTFSSFYPLAAASPTLTSFGLERHGLHWRHAPAVLGHPLPDGSWALLHRDREVTAGLLEEQHAGDGEAWLAL
jgi:phytoene dehydrogenase-like protein